MVLIYSGILVLLEKLSTRRKQLCREQYESWREWEAGQNSLIFIRTTNIDSYCVTFKVNLPVFVVREKKVSKQESKTHDLKKRCSISTKKVLKMPHSESPKKDRNHKTEKFVIVCFIPLEDGRLEDVAILQW